MPFLIGQTFNYGGQRSEMGVALDTLQSIGTNGFKIPIPSTAAVIFGPVIERTHLVVWNVGGQVLLKKVAGNPPSPTLSPADSLWQDAGGYVNATLEAGEALAALGVAYT